MVVPTDNTTAQPAIFIGDSFKSHVRDAFQDDLQKHADFIEAIEHYMEQRSGLDVALSLVLFPGLLKFSFPIRSSCRLQDFH